MASSPQTRLPRLIPAEIVSHEGKPWASVTFKGERHTLVVRPDDEVFFLQKMQAFDVTERAIPGWLLCDVEYKKINETDYEVMVMYLEENPNA